MMNKKSTIQVTDKTKQKLRNLKLTPSETYENIILRLLEKNGEDKMDKREITLNLHEEEDLKKGELVHWTSSEFAFNAKTGLFDKDSKEKRTALVTNCEDDFTEFEQGKCNTGGCYSFHQGEFIKWLD